MQLLKKLNYCARLFDKFALNRFQYLSLVITVLLFDRITKSFALNLSEPLSIFKSYIYLQLTLNKGISWGLFSSESLFHFIIINLLIISVILYLIKYIYNMLIEGHSIYAELLILSGALANLFDRFYYKAVIDFIVIDFGFWTFPVFNFADVAIVLGGIYLLIELIFKSKK